MKRTRSNLWRVLWAAPFTLVLGSCGGGQVRVGAVLPQTGAAEVYGKSIQRGIDLAAELAKADSGAPAVQLITVDSGSDPERAQDELKKLLDGGALTVIGGVTSAEALAMVPVAEKVDRILLSPSASLPQLTGISSNFFRIYPSDFAEGAVMARYAYDNLRLTTAVILAKQETYAKGIQQVFADEFQRKGGKILEVIEFPPNTVDFAALADRALTLRPESVYVAAYAEEILRMVSELRAHKFPGMILTTSSFAAASTIANTGAAAEGVLFTQASFEVEGELAPQVKSFVTAYRAKYRSDPDIYAAHGFDAYNIVLEAIRQGGTSGSSFWKGMRNIREYPGVTGVIQFDEKGDVQKFPRVYVVEKGRAVDREQQRQRQLDDARKRIEEIERQLRELQQKQGS